MTTEPEIKAAAERAVLHHITSGGWIKPDYESRIKLPAEILSQAWESVDSDGIITALAERLERELADRIVSIMAAEISTDIKQILSVKERREAIRALARRHMQSIMGGEG